MKKLEYKGFEGTAEFSKADNCFFGEIIGIGDNDCVIYEGDTIDELFDVFKDAVDDYLDYCQEVGKQPAGRNALANASLPDK